MSLGLLNSSRRKQWDQIAKAIEVPVEYWDFPSTIVAFGYSMKGSSLLEDDRAWYRIRGKQATLINWVCAPWELEESVENMKDQGYKLKSLNWRRANWTDPYKVGQKVNEFKVEGLYDWETSTSHHSSKTRSTIRRKLNKAMKSYVTEQFVPSKNEVNKLFEAWVKQASERHFMVVKGHYQEYIRMLYNLNINQGVITFRNQDGRLDGLCGYEHFKNKAQITLMKNRGGDNNFPVFFWIETVTRLSNTFSEVFCGSTADKLKRLLGFKEYNSWKLEL